MRKLWVQLTILTAIIVVISALLIGTNYETRKQKSENERELTKYAIIAEEFELGTYFYSIEEPIDVAFYPTEFTLPMIENWRTAAGALPVFSYPEKLILENEWVEAYDFLQDSLADYYDYYSEEEETRVEMADIKRYIYSDSVSDSLQEVFEEAGIEYD
ncbi:hypothetical protein HXZ66_01940 [Bacillus sp. A116_S68]|nr:hypothetical protein HXZ66_01940 [Bacillus sp. A116_S68]